MLRLTEVTMPGGKKMFNTIEGGNYCGDVCDGSDGNHCGGHCDSKSDELAFA